MGGWWIGGGERLFLGWGEEEKTEFCITIKEVNLPVLRLFVHFDLIKYFRIINFTNTTNMAMEQAQTVATIHQLVQRESPG